MAPYAGDAQSAAHKFFDFEKALKDRAPLIGDACASRILRESFPPIESKDQFAELLVWIEKTSKHISVEIDRRERKQLFAVAVLSPIIAAIIAVIGVVVTVIFGLLKIFRD